ncbi:unnamed protein product [Strongylus vulgaris]|uniref:Uncharacterized protein n=1 Tax=Strongylus vulgaris TaxID=40348 RepID=A0A3P7INR6_STRVU|nr:unnamed protein product [Strongylus vulgaris]
MEFVYTASEGAANGIESMSAYSLHSILPVNSRECDGAIIVWSAGDSSDYSTLMGARRHVSVSTSPPFSQRSFIIAA